MLSFRAVQDQRGLAGGAHGLHVGAEVLDPCRHDRVGGHGGTADDHVPAAGDGLLADARSEVLVEVVEVLVEVGEPREAVAFGGSLDAVEDLLRNTLGVVVALHEERFERGEEGELRHALVAVAGDVAGELSRSHREADENDVAQVECLQHRVEVGGEGVVVVAGVDLRRSAEPTAVVGDDAIALCEQLAGLALPAVAVERIAVDQDDGLTRSLVFVVELDRGAVLVADGDVTHDPDPFDPGENDRSRSMSPM